MGEPVVFVKPAPQQRMHVSVVMSRMVQTFLDNDWWPSVSDEFVLIPRTWKKKF